MAFPGGRSQPADMDLRQTAQRECMEEVGLVLETQGTYLGVLEGLKHPKIWVEAFVYHVSRQPVLLPKFDEVASTHWVCLHQLYSRSNRGMIQRSFQNHKQSFPAILILEEPIWGVSLLLLEQLFSSLHLQEQS